MVDRPANVNTEPRPVPGVHEVCWCVLHKFSQAKDAFMIGYLRDSVKTGIAAYSLEALEILGDSTYWNNPYGGFLQNPNRWKGWRCGGRGVVFLVRSGEFCIPEVYN